MYIIKFIRLRNAIHVKLNEEFEMGMKKLVLVKNKGFKMV